MSRIFRISVAFGVFFVAFYANAQTQLDLDVSADDAVKRADEELNRVYKQVIATLNDTQKEYLKQSQFAWVKYRDLCANAEGSMYEGGSIKPMVILNCNEALTKEQTERLRRMLPEAIANEKIILSTGDTQKATLQIVELEMKKVYTDYMNSNPSPTVQDAQVAWQTYRDLCTTAEASLFSGDIVKVIETKCIIELTQARTIRLKELFMDGYPGDKEDEPADEPNPKIAEDPTAPLIVKVVESGDLEAIKKLLQQGVDVNAATDADITAMHVAAEMGNEEIVKLLLAANAIADKGDFDGYTPADYARRVGNINIAKLIESSIVADTSEPPSGDNEPKKEEYPISVSDTKISSEKGIVNGVFYFKGLHLGMKLEDAAIVLKELGMEPDMVKDTGGFKITKVPLDEKLIEVSHSPYPNNNIKAWRVIATPDSNNTVVRFIFSGESVSRLFGLGDMTVLEFIEMFCGAYEIPSMEEYIGNKNFVDTMAGLQPDKEGLMYRDRENGWELVIYETKELHVTKITKVTQTKFD